MHKSDTTKEFWERKILRWENSRYTNWGILSPTSWSVRRRLADAEKIIRRRFSSHGRILDLGCGSGYLAEKLNGACSRFYGIDIAENAVVAARNRVPSPLFQFTSGNALSAEWPEVELTIFLGLTDWLQPEEMKELFGKIRSREILFSFTEAGPLSPYRLYRKWMDKSPEASCRAKVYSQMFVTHLLADNGYSMELVVPPTVANPGGLVWATAK